MMGDMMLKLLRLAGHFVQLVNDGDTALCRISEDILRFDLVVTDHNMPHLNGLKLAERFRAAGYAGRIVVFSSNIESGVRDLYRRHAVETFLDKTMTLDVILRAVEATPRYE